MADPAKPDVPNEQTLIDAGEEEMVRAYRLRFQEVVSKQISDPVEEATGRKVLAYHSQVLFNPDRAIEMFVLDAPPDRQ